MPVVFAEGHGVLGLPTSVDAGLRPRPEEPTASLVQYLDPSSIYLKDGTTYYPQQTTSHWQADWRDGVAGGESVVVNWSDNIVKQTWTTRSVIRVETVLYQTPAVAMNAYTMGYLLGKGPTELWGTTGGVYASNYNTVYSVTARLKIEKIDKPNGDVVLGMQSFDEAVWEKFGDDGPGGYSAEVNVSGNLIYGYNWMLGQWDGTTDDKLGWWRLTFTLDPTATYSITPEGESAQDFTVNRNVVLAGLDLADVDPAVRFKPTRPNSYTSVLEIEVVNNRKGGKKPSSPGGGEQ